MKKIFGAMLTLILYSCSIGALLASMRNNDTYLIGLVIVALIVAGRIEKRLEEVEK